MKEILQALESRIKSPVIGYFTIAVILFNWQEFFYLFADKGEAETRIIYFVDNTSTKSLLWYPALSASIYTLTYPWINLVFLYLCRNPTDLKNNIQASTEHKLLIQKTKLEQIRADYLATAEAAVIDQAKRDVEVENIADETVKENVRANIESLRQEKKTKDNKNNNKENYSTPDELFDIADSYKERARQSRSESDAFKWVQRAEEIEEKAHKIIGKQVNA